MDDFSEMEKICDLIQDPKNSKKFLEGKHLESELSDLERDVEEIEKNLINVPSVIPLSSDEPTKQINSSNIKLLQSALKRVSDLFTYPDLPEVQKAALKDDLIRNVKEMEEINTSLESTLEEKQDLLKRLTEVRDNMKSHRGELQNAGNSVGQKRQTVDLLKKKLLKLKESHKELFPEFMEFVESQFPQITGDDVKRYQNEFPRTHLRSAKNLSSMSDILENLLTAHKTETPYIEIDKATWPPYIDLLASTGIIQFHPDNSRFYCLCDF